MMQASGALADTVLARVDSASADSAKGLLDSLAVDSTDVDTSSIGDVVGGFRDAGSALASGDVSEAAERVINALWTFGIQHLVPAILIAIAFWVVLRVVRGILNRTLGRSHHIDVGVEQLIMRAVRFVIVAIAAVTVAEKLGLPVTGFIAGLGIAGLALGFAAQDTVQNLIAGVTILIDRPFRVGDNIELQETFGTVEEITLRSTRVRTLNNQIAILPNAKVIEEKILNHSMHRALRVVVPFGIAYKESPAEARSVVLGLVADDNRLHPDYEPQVVVTALNDSSVDMELRVFLKDSKLEVPVGFEYRERIFEALKSANIEIPFPHLQLFIDEAKAFENTRLLQAPGGDA
ncbi:mechanosensitive ion channel family protein [Rubricoccus marinus]|uniref:Mechanosensitive ion channel protein MscS n=1 Tax=Rubricoccus marinus TaxID=716817 RepID=A0A259TXM0_9BACT|nr:mechanosensitive ion channel family protein [Rubricoccus marinus]OZC02523.1 hypothetical protein BSZ36_05760 [Rubricoccus marinus]